jgi:hypothetical protein
MGLLMNFGASIFKNGIKRIVFKQPFELHGFEASYAQNP